MAKIKIQFDNVTEPDTKLAEEYLKKEQKQFHSKGYKDEGSAGYDKCRNRIYYADYKKFRGTMVLVQSISEIPEKLFNLANKIEENVELFCQLDYLIRKTPIDESKNVEMPLLIQNLLNCSKNTSGGKFYVGFMWSISVSAESSLAVLGCIAQALMSSVTHVSIESSPQTAAVCCLFTDLCHQVGLEEKVRLALLNDKDMESGSSTVDLKEMHELKDGCVGIVSAKSDVESAVDTFLAATDRYPWNVTKILVQDGVMERFKNALEWKTNSTRNNRVFRIIDESLQTLSKSAYNYDKKIFLFEFTGKQLDDKSFGVILVDGYRTTKELLSLLKDSNHFSASIWCNDITESNEIAFNIGSNIIWINDLCNFTGPPKASQAFYSLIDSHFATSTVNKIPEMDEIMKLRQSWLAINKTKRENIVKDVLKNAPKPTGSNFRIIKEIQNLKLTDIECAFDNFSFIENNRICHGTEVMPIIMKWFDPINIATILFVLKGGGVIVDSGYVSDNHAFSKFVFEELKENGAPIVSVKEYFRYGDYRILGKPIYKMKVVWSHFGTMFAN